MKTLILTSLRRSLQWRLLLLWLLVMLLPALPAALRGWITLSDALDYSVHAPVLAERLDGLALADLGRALAENGFRATLLWSVLGAVLASSFAAGMAATAIRSDKAAGFRTLLEGGLQQYPRMLAMLSWGAIPLGVALAIALVIRKMTDAYVLEAELNAVTQGIESAAMWAVGLLLLLAAATLDAGRAVLTLDRRRFAPWRAWFDGCRAIVRRPLATLGSYAAITLVQLLLAGLVYVLRFQLPQAGTAGFAAALALAQFSVLILAWGRCARLFALADAVRG